MNEFNIWLGHVSTIAGSASFQQQIVDGVGGVAEFYRLSALAILSSGDLLVADQATIRLVRSSGT